MSKVIIIIIEIELHLAWFEAYFKNITLQTGL